MFSDRLIRPGDTAYFDIIHAFNGYRTCYYRTLNVGSANSAAAGRVHARARVHGQRDRRDPPGRHRRPTSSGISRPPQEFGFATEEEAFGLQYCHGLGLSNWERPLMSRYHSFEHPVDAAGGHGVRDRDLLADRRTVRPRPGSRRRWSSPPSGCELLTRFPADQLYVAGTQILERLRPPAAVDTTGAGAGTR